MVFEGVPGGPMDCWGDVTTPEEHLAKIEWILETFLPWEAERCRDVELTDDNGILAGRFPPTVRKPVGAAARRARSCSGWPTPSSSTTRSPARARTTRPSAPAVLPRRASSTHGDGPYDAGFMEQTFERYWDYAQYVTDWTNALLGAAAAARAGAARRRQRPASRSRTRFVNGFDDPRDFFEWFMDPEDAGRYLARIAA